MQKEHFKVSVRLMTFNHAKFIKEALEGILMQQTNFLVEIVVGDDFSTDNTLEIVKTFSDTENIKINVLERKIGDTYWQNRQKYGRLYNFYDILQNCKGEYVALLDGDDFWTDPLKLQKQIDFLDKNPNFIASFHKVKVIDEAGKTIRENKFSDYSLHDYSSQLLITGRVLPVLACCFRNISKEIPEEFFYSGLGDKFLSSFLGNYGAAKFQHDILPSAYRVGNHGLWSKNNSLDKIKMNLLTLTQLWSYYKRVGKSDNAEIILRYLLRQSLKLFLLTKSANGIEKVEKFTLKIHLKFFYLLRIPLTIKQKFFNQ